MYLQQGIVVTSASDLKSASECEFAFLRKLDQKLGRAAHYVEVDDPMLARAGELGNQHEERVLDRLRQQFGAGVTEIARPDKNEPGAIEAACADTLAALRAGQPVVFQATFSEPDFIGFADFIVRQPDGRYRVQDSKLARHARVTALMQLAAYARQLELLGIACDHTVELLLGDGTISSHRLIDIMPVFLKRRARLHQIVAERQADRNVVAWGDTRYASCGRCPTCEAEVEASRNVLMVGGVRVTQRARLAAAGITTIDELAAGHRSVVGIQPSTLDALREQARLQLDAESRKAAAVASGWVEGDAPVPPPFRVIDPTAIDAIPVPNDGDLFFDFEGDPLYSEQDRWGIDYLWGMVDTDEVFTRFWSHDLAAEKQALLDFLALVKVRRETHPDLHIYHYAAYERTHLASIAARHGVGEADVDQLFHDGVLIDLYPIVKRAVRVGSRSYSIKKLEPLYMGAELRTANVTNGGDSILEYVRARELAGQADAASQAEGDKILADLADYNRYDCVSTKRLRDWLLGLRSSHGPRMVMPQLELPGKVYETSPVATKLVELAGAERELAALAERELAESPTATAIVAEHSSASTALRIAAAAIDYHAREAKTYWMNHFLRVEQPVETWEHTRDVFIVDSGAIETDWHVPGPRAKVAQRVLRLRGTWAPGSKPSPGSEVYRMYAPAPFPVRAASARGAERGCTITSADGDEVVVTERAVDGYEWTMLPMALTPGPPPNNDNLAAAIAEWAAPVAADWPNPPRSAALDLLLRRPPACAGGLVPATGAADALIDAVTTSLRRLDRSYLAVQGPPGTGKTFLGSQVIARLVRDRGWRVGVVAQSHAVVENLLGAIVSAGLDVAKVGKALGSSSDPADTRFTVFDKSDRTGMAAFLTANTDGCVVGGTQWDFANTKRVTRGQLDLLVIDEAGQFSLGSTIASAVAAKNLLLLGDPQQLPQVSQGTHPAPVDVSALEWLADAHEVLPAEFGYFLAETQRMHPAVTASVSHLSYDDKLRSAPIASLRHLDGVTPGAHAVPVAHSDNQTESPEEAARVLELVEHVLGRAWIDAGYVASVPTALPARPLGESDVIVVAPYNAQVERIRETLDAAGHTEVRVGTVDKFQGQEAAVAIVSLTASSPEAAPRGAEFVLNTNRLNVAVSRAKFAAYLCYSPELVEGLPNSAAAVAYLSRFIALVS
ncbi:MAG TPA: TM0106 family RecB-like putative nuclease [Candidatus Lumbricidophila sp.]|nr:TM0106 family RecB-like putative nuclease [Candidatus Lumbricidophila sp.]